MRPVMCVEVLLATVALWIALFGVCDVIMSRVADDGVKLGFYAVLTASVGVFVYVNDQLNMCSLL